ncbi:3',5'-cyclic adenosine monophosphate phosphodiesterase CpdA [Commensalibacter sp. Nvir]|nr:3',5'-cyclic adenosine monophosphate phosphodiesterase CpdA [Commensalibacter sp. Nvir]
MCIKQKWLNFPKKFTCIKDNTLLAPYKIAHISDIHLPIENLQFSTRSLCNKRFLSFLSWKKRQYNLQKKYLDNTIEDIKKFNPNLVLISGDLTNLALPEEFEQAAKWLRSLPFRKIYIVPGNHDALVKTNWNQTFALWTPWTMAFSQQDYPVIFKEDQIAIIGLNTAIPTLPFLANGRIDHEQLKRLKDLLRKTREEQLITIIMLHHPPLSNIVAKRKSLENIKNLQNILKKEGANLILYGHSHKTKTEKFLDIPILGISSASSSSVKLNKKASWRKIFVESDKHFSKIKFSVRSQTKNFNFIEEDFYSLTQAL